MFLRYLESLESKLAEQDHLQKRITELEARLRELDPSTNYFSRSTGSFVNSPETSTIQSYHSNHLSPTIDTTHSQSYSPKYATFSDERSSIVRGTSPLFSTVGPQADQETNPDPGVFEVGEAGKGWYLGSASGSKSFHQIL